MVTTRLIVIVPTANAMGYDCKSRMEDGIDPNQYFPYYLMDRTLCMRTVAGWILNEIFRDCVFHISITFHGGMVEIF